MRAWGMDLQAAQEREQARVQKEEEKEKQRLERERKRIEKETEKEQKRAEKEQGKAAKQVCHMLVIEVPQSCTERGREGCWALPGCTIIHAHQ